MNRLGGRSNLFLKFWKSLKKFPALRPKYTPNSKLTKVDEVIDRFTEFIIGIILMPNRTSEVLGGIYIF